MSTMVLGPIELKEQKKKSTEVSAPQILTSSTFDSRIHPRLYPLNYACIRKLRDDPTCQLARWAVLSPILHTPWIYTSASDSKKKEVSQEMLQAVEDNFEPLRDDLLQRAVFGTLDYGWQPFEQIYQPEDGMIKHIEFKGLLQDFTTILVYTNTGSFAGFVNEPILINVQSAQIIQKDYALNTTFSVEGTDWYGYSVFRSLQPIIGSWDEVEKSSNRYDKKVAGATWVIYYPVGKTPWNGAETDNAIIARGILNSLEASGGVAVPDEIQDWIDDAIDREAKGKWRIELLSADSSRQQTFVTRQKYLDALKIRAFGLTERSILEGSHGTKAEADVHSDVSIAIVHSRHKILCNQITTNCLWNFMRFNFGKKYEKAVVIRPAPLIDAQFATVKDIYRLIMQSPETLAKEVSNINLGEMRSELGIPSMKDAENTIEVEMHEGNGKEKPLVGATKDV